jgi:hypothetical protein
MYEQNIYSRGTVKTLAYACESLISFYIGVLTWDLVDNKYHISWPFVFWELFVFFFARIVMIFGLAFLTKLYNND